MARSGGLFLQRKKMEGGLCERCQDRRRRFKNFYSVECEPTSGRTRPRRHPPGTQCWGAQKTGRASCRRAWHKSAMKELARRLRTEEGKTLIPQPIASANVPRN